jgi:L-alanine-DL-glutamate epimerase-like enolase superfamily enzyme
MKITDVSVTLFRWDGLPAIGYHAMNRKAGEPGELGLLSLKTDEGVEGLSLIGKVLSGAGADGQALIKYLKPVLLGQNPLDRERLNQAIWRRSRLAGMAAIGAVDVALWDLAGKVAGLPIHRLLGSFRDQIPAYASSDHLPSPEHYAEEALKYKAMGWKAYKLHPPSQWQKDIEACAAVRKAVGDDFTLMLDSTWIYDYREALKVGRAVEELGFYWYEDPLPHQDIYNYVKLKQKLDVPIMATELPVAGFESYAIWITQQATDYLRGDVPLKGGLTTMVKTAHLAEAFDLKYEAHAGGNSTNNLANLHLEMAIRNCEFHEILLPVQAHDYALHNEITVDREGYIQAPTGPGLGAEFNFDLIRRQTSATLT